MIKILSFLLAVSSRITMCFFFPTMQEKIIFSLFMIRSCVIIFRRIERRGLK